MRAPTGLPVDGRQPDPESDQRRAGGGVKGQQLPHGLTVAARPPAVADLWPRGQHRGAGTRDNPLGPATGGGTRWPLRIS